MLTRHQKLLLRLANSIENDRYVETINKLFMRHYPLNLPSDVIQTIVNFPFMTAEKLLELDHITEYQFVIVSIIADTVDRMDEIVNLVIKLYEKENIDKNVKRLAKSFIDNVTANKIILKLCDDEEFYNEFNNMNSECDIKEEMKRYVFNKYDNLDNYYLDQYLDNMLDNMISCSESCDDSCDVK